jgi:1-acyl-sn-glycerol-3-phosphate acyltransferase
MTYLILRFFVRFVLRFFVKDLTINGLANLPKTGAVLLASNHPNSFFDAILLACLLERPMWSLARGDAFRKNYMKKFFTKIKMMPVYRLSEGKEFLGENDATFNQCLELFRKGEMVLIFTEGISVHQTKLLPLKKGTARLAQKAWLEDLPLQIVPIGLSYDSFDKFGKIININFGKTIQRADYLPIGRHGQELRNDGFFLKEFNEDLVERINPLLSTNFSKTTFFKNLLFYLGILLNFPLYFICQQISKKFTKGTVFYDSVLFGTIVFLSPIYWLILVILANVFFA